MSSYIELPPGSKVWLGTTPDGEKFRWEIHNEERRVASSTGFFDTQEEARHEGVNFADRLRWRIVSPEEVKPAVPVVATTMLDDEDGQRDWYLQGKDRKVVAQGCAGDIDEAGALRLAARHAAKNGMVIVPLFPEWTISSRISTTLRKLTKAIEVYIDDEIQRNAGRMAREDQNQGQDIDSAVSKLADVITDEILKAAQAYQK